jgi:hypothetical protein
VIYFRSTLYILLAFALHLGCTALVHVGWPPQPLVLLAVLMVWLERVPAIGRVLVPAALLVDIMQPTHVPLVTLGVLIAWIAAALVQRQWLTNHSLASLFGLVVLSAALATGVTALSLWVATNIGTSGIAFRDTWFARGVLQRVSIEIGVTMLAGISLRISARFFRRRFLYASR